MNADIMPVAELPHRKEIKAAPTAPQARRRAGLSLWRGPPRARQATCQQGTPIKAAHRHAGRWCREPSSSAHDYPARGLRV